MLLLLYPCNANADALALSSISFSNLQITASTGSVVFGGPWTSEGFAQSQDSLGAMNPRFTSSGGGTSTAATTVPYANALGSANAGTLNGSASSQVNLTGITDPTSGNSVGQGTLQNVFMITGGTGSTTVAFSTVLAGLLQMTTDSSAIGESTEAIFNLTLNSDSVLFFGSMLTGGLGFNSTTPISQTLSQTLTLSFDTPYFLTIQSDAESSAISTATVPEPSTLPMMLVGLVLMGGAAQKTLGQRRTRTVQK
jgi:hypothetical protein